MAFVGQTATETTLKEVVAVVMTAKTLEEQVKLLSAADGAKPYIIRSYERIAQFFIRNGRLKEVPGFRPLVDAAFLVKATQ